MTRLEERLHVIESRETKELRPWVDGSLVASPGTASPGTGELSCLFDGVKEHPPDDSECDVGSFLSDLLSQATNMLVDLI